MAARVDSFKQDSMKASIALKVLVTDKARWEADLATLRASMQDMECNRGESSLVGGFFLFRVVDERSNHTSNNISGAHRPSQDESRQPRGIFFGLFNSTEGHPG